MTKEKALEEMKKLGATDDEIKNGTVYLTFNNSENKYELLRGKKDAFGKLN